MKASRPLPFVRALLGAAAMLSLMGGVVPSAMAQAASQAAASNDVAEIQRLIKEGQHAQALKLIDESLARNPKDPQMRFRRGVALSMLDRKSEALSVFQKLVEDHPEMPAPYNNMAVIHGAQGEYEKARNALERAIRTNPAYATAYQNLGDVYAQLASQAYTKALQLDKNDATLPPKLSLLRELTSGNGSPPATTVASVTKPAPAPVPSAKPTAPVASTTPPAAAPATPPAATKPTPPVASAPAVQPPAAKPAPAAPPEDKKPAPATDRAADDVQQAVKAWAAAWSRRDVNDYVAAYTPTFDGQAGSRKEWVQERRDRIAGKKSIKVTVSDVKVSVQGDKATARFRQSYTSDALSTSSRKTLEFVRSGGKWLIREERVGG